MKKLFISFLLFTAHFFVFSEAAEQLDSALNAKYFNETYYELKGKLLDVEFLGKTSTFNIFCSVPKNPENAGSDFKSDFKQIPMFSDADNSLSTGFLLKIDGEVYDLNNTNRIQKELRRLERSAQLVYTLGHRVRFVLDFSLVASQKDKPEDLVCVKMYTISLDKKIHEVAIKGIFDTTAGEGSSVHFTTSHGIKVRGETVFTGPALEVNRDIISSNDRTAFQFVLGGNGISPVKSVIIANIDQLHKMNWSPIVRKGRGFTNIRGYDDSGVMIDWADFIVQGEQNAEHTFYIAVATNDEQPRGLFYIDGVDHVIAETAPKDPAEPPKKETPPAKKENPEKRTNVDFVVQPIKDYQLDPEYIQRLIDRIDSLQSSKNVDQRELRKLNNELDAILEKLRQR